MRSLVLGKAVLFNSVLCFFGGSIFIHEVPDFNHLFFQIKILLNKILKFDKQIDNVIQCPRYHKKHDEDGGKGYADKDEVGNHHKHSLRAKGLFLFQSRKAKHGKKIFSAHRDQLLFLGL
jgi:hypothetical protein